MPAGTSLLRWAVPVPMAAFAAAVAALAALALPAGAGATNTNVSISNYAWSKKDVTVRLGEHVTWYWIGPDLAHSVTGFDPNDSQWDSDPDTNQPSHALGDSYTITFTQPGTYNFHCKLHSNVRGTITVEDTPGDPNSDAGPVPANNVDVTAPTPGELRLKRTAFRKRTSLHVALDEAGKMDVDYFRLGPKGKRTYAGYADWEVHVGYNDVSFGQRTKVFRARPGRYVAELRVTDDSANVTDPTDIAFRIKPKRSKPKKRRRHARGKHRHGGRHHKHGGDKHRGKKHHGKKHHGKKARGHGKKHGGKKHHGKKHHGKKHRGK